MPLIVPVRYISLFLASLAVLFLSLDLGRNFNLASANQIEKGLVIVWGGSLLLYCKVNWYALLFFVIISIVVWIPSQYVKYPYFNISTLLFSFTQILAILIFL